MGYGELMFMLMDKRASGPFLAEILFICCFEGKGQTYEYSLFSGFQRGVSNDCYHVRTVISNHLDKKRKQENDHEK